MQRPLVFLDEDVQAAVAAGLRRRGFDVTTTVSERRTGASDEDQLAFASAQGRVLVTFNRGDFARLHGQYLSDGKDHRGIIISRQCPAGAMVRALAKLLGSREAREFRARLIWLDIS